MPPPEDLAPARPMAEGPHVVVLSSLFPSARQPAAGLFVRERMFRVARRLPLAVVSPQPWFPGQGLLRRWRPGFRPGAPAREQQKAGTTAVDVVFPRFLSAPGALKRLDGLMMALGAWPSLRRLQRAGRLDLLDAHFGYPDGYAATLLGRWLEVPVSITLRGTESRHARDPVLGPLLRTALQRATRVFAVSESLRQVALGLGIPGDKVQVVGNGVDIDRFQPLHRGEARERLGLPPDAPVLISVGGLVERKGFHRVIELMPDLMREHPDLHYLIVGGPSPEGDMGPALKAQVQSLGLADRIHFLGTLPPEQLSLPLSAADVFVLATRNEGWANVFLEAMACGLPVVTTDVGGNREVVCRPELGTVVPFGDVQGLRAAVGQALRTAWSRDALREYASQNTWHRRVNALEAAFVEMAAAYARSRP